MHASGIGGAIWAMLLHDNADRNYGEVFRPATIWSVLRGSRLGRVMTNGPTSFITSNASAIPRSVNDDCTVHRILGGSPSRRTFHL